MVRWFVATRGGLFVVFVEWKLATRLCANVAFNPSQALEAYADVTSAQTEKILVPAPWAGRTFLIPDRLFCGILPLELASQNERI